MHRRVGSVLLIGCLLLTGACSKKSSNSTSSSTRPTTAGQSATTVATSNSATTQQASSGLTGTWTGTWTRTAPTSGGGAFGLALNQSGANLSGSVTQAAGSLCMQGTKITGTVNGSNVTMTLSNPTDSSVKVQLTGQLSGNKLSGNLTATCSGLAGQGTWDVTES